MCDILFSFSHPVPPTARPALYPYTHDGEVDADAGQEVDVRTELSRNQFLSSSPAVPLKGLSFPNRFQSPPHIHPRIIQAPFKV